MNHLYKKNGLLFAILWIIIYVIFLSLADQISASIGIEKSITAVVCALLTAILVSSVTFGIGHIVNLFNGSGADLFSNLLQVAYAIAGGFLFTILFYYSKSLWACIATHSILNALSVFANESAKTPAMEILSAAALILISVLYAGYTIKRHGKIEKASL